MASASFSVLSRCLFRLHMWQEHVYTAAAAAGGRDTCFRAQNSVSGNVSVAASRAHYEILTLMSPHMMCVVVVSYNCSQKLGTSLGLITIRRGCGGRQGEGRVVERRRN